VVSHDRFFMDKVVDHLFVFSGKGDIRIFPWNYSVYRQSEEYENLNIQSTILEQKPRVPTEKKKEKYRSLSFNEKRELETLETEIGHLEKEKADLETALSSGILSAKELTEKSQRIGEVIQSIEMKTSRWMELSEGL